MMTETLTLQVPESLMRVVRERVASGEFRNETEAVLDALEAWSEEPDFHYSDDELRALVQESLDDPEPSMTLDELRESMDREHAAWLSGAQRAD